MFIHNLAQNWPFFDLMRRIGPIFNEDHRPNLRFRPKYYKKLVFVSPGEDSTQTRPLVDMLEKAVESADEALMSNVSNAYQSILYP